MADWADLQDAYGSAEMIPELVDEAVSSGFETGDAWADLWGRLCHQGTVYSASYAAIPLLADAALRHVPAGYVASLHLAAAIVASKDGDVTREPARQRYAAELAELQSLALRSLALASNDVEFIYGLETLMAFEDGGIWQRCLSYLADGEVPLECPNCQESILIDTASEAPTAVVWDATRKPTGVVPVDVHPGTPEARLLDLARGHGRQAVATSLQYLFGQIRCPDCDATFLLTDVLP